MSTIVDKAGQSFWNGLWQGQAVPGPVDPHRASLRNHVYRGFHRFFTQALAGLPCPDLTLVEVGCGRSRWLPYFAREFGLRVAGIDYSAVGCAQARAILANSGVSGTVIEANLFEPPAQTLDAFDVLVTFGVVEHFTDTAGTIAALAKLLRPGGLMITIIPNMAGWVGGLQRAVDRAIYEIHVPLNRAGLRRAHDDAGLQVQQCDYLLSVSWAVINTAGWKSNPLYRMIQLLPFALSSPFWMLERFGLALPPNRNTSPYIACLARKRPAEAS